MTPTPNAVERCKAVPIGERSEMSRAVRIDAHEMVYVTDLWKAFDTLLAENARLASEVRAGEAKDAVIAAARNMAAALRGNYHSGQYSGICGACASVSAYESALKSLGAEESARASGARGGAE